MPKYHAMPTAHMQQLAADAYALDVADRHVKRAEIVFFIVSGLIAATVTACIVLGYVCYIAHVSPIGG